MQLRNIVLVIAALATSTSATAAPEPNAAPAIANERAPMNFAPRDELVKKHLYTCPTISLTYRCMVPCDVAARKNYKGCQAF